MDLSGEIFKGIRNVGRKKVAKIDLFSYATDLYMILDNNGLIERLKETALLGNIAVKKRDSYSRFDYVMMQLYMYQFVRRKLNSELYRSLGSNYKCTELKNMVCIVHDSDFQKSPSIADALQIMALIYNIGHFKNTFTSSRAMIDVLKSDRRFYDAFISNFSYDSHKNIARNIIDSNQYHRFHLLNSLLLLLNMDREDIVVKFSINILTEYLSPIENQSDKTSYIFRLFRTIREVCFVAMDLSIAPVPVYLDIHNDRYLKNLLKERLAGYNDQKQINNLFKGLNKLLQDTVYNEEQNAIIQFDIARRIKGKALKLDLLMEELSANYLNLIGYAEGGEYDVFNRKYSQNHDFDSDNILKLSFDYEMQSTIEEIVDKLNRTNFVKAGWYYRKNEKKITMLVAIKTKCNNVKNTSFRVMKLILNSLSGFQNKYEEESFHTHLLLTTKFFLYYLLGSNRIVLEGRIDPDICVLMDRGHKKRIHSINKLLKNKSMSSNDDEVHEVEFLRAILIGDSKNDLGLTVCSSIVVKDRENDNKRLAEFDGMIIFPNRDKDQIIFTEAKNTKEKPKHSIKCLKEKFKTLDIAYEETEIQSINKDCKYDYSII